MTAALPSPPRRGVGRPRQFDDRVEREMIIEAGYATLRDHRSEMTLAQVMAAAGVPTRSFYRHFDSKDALLCAMYRRDAEYAASRLAARLASTDGPAAAVEAWVDEVYGLLRSKRRAERVAVLGSIPAGRAVGIENEAAYARELLVAPLRAAIAGGVADGSLAAVDAASAADLIAVAVMHGSGVYAPKAGHRVDQREMTAFCRRALGLDGRR